MACLGFSGSLFSVCPLQCSSIKREKCHSRDGMECMLVLAITHLSHSKTYVSLFTLFFRIYVRIYI